MDQNQNNNPPDPDPNTNPAGPTPLGNPPDDFSAPPPPLPADPVPVTTDPSTSASPWASNPVPSGGTAPPQPSFSTQPDPGVFPPLAPGFDAGSQSTSSSGTPAWVAPVPVSDPPPTQAPPPPVPPAEEPMPTFTPPVAEPDFGVTPSFGTDQAGLGTAAPALESAPQPDPSASQFPPTWPPTPSAAGSFDMGAASPEPERFGTSGLGESGSGESGPTDLSNLMTGSVGGDTASPPPASVAATLVSPQLSPQPADANPGLSQAVTSTPSGGFPKWILLVGGILLLVVVAASAYFILGVGSSGQEQTSLPAQQAPLTNPPRAILPSPAVQPPPPSTSSASFGNLQGTEPQPSTQSGQSGASALELLRQRQGR